MPRLGTRAAKPLLEEGALRTLVERLPLTIYLDRLESGGSSSVYTSPRLQTVLRRTIGESASGDERFLDVMHPDDRERVLIERRRTRERGECAVGGWFGAKVPWCLRVTASMVPAVGRLAGAY